MNMQITSPQLIGEVKSLECGHFLYFCAFYPEIDKDISKDIFQTAMTEIGDGTRQIGLYKILQKQNLSDKEIKSWLPTRSILLSQSLYQEEIDELSYLAHQGLVENGLNPDLVELHYFEDFGNRANFAVYFDLHKDIKQILEKMETVMDIDVVRVEETGRYFQHIFKCYESVSPGMYSELFVKAAYRIPWDLYE